MTRPLFIVGNKRSGTSHLVRVLNLHPNVFVSHESDIVWILYQLHHGRTPRAHPWDSDRGMRRTLEDGRDVLRRDRSPWENFLAVQRRLMERGTPWLPPMRKAELRWIGDKKPFQHGDPRLRPFIRRTFPDARFLHIVRHPLAVAASSERFNRTPNGDFWVDLSPAQKVERWALHERQVLALREAQADRVHSLRYEDLCEHPERELSAVFEFLELTPDPGLLAEAARQTRPAANVLPPIRCSPEARQIAGRYGYALDRPRPRLRLIGRTVLGWAWPPPKASRIRSP